MPNQLLMKEIVLPTSSIERNVLNLDFKRCKLHGIPRHCIQSQGGRSENGTFWWRSRKECCMRFMRVLYKQLRQRLPNNNKMFSKIFLLSIAKALEVSNLNSDAVTVIYFSGEIFHLLISRMSMILHALCAEFWNTVLPVAQIHLENYHSLQGLNTSVVKGGYTKNFQSAEQCKK